MESRRCRMLTEEGLCTIQQNLGEASLCQTCRIYPRHMEAYPGFREYMLMLSCPEAARMMLTRKEPMIFREKHVQEWEKTPRGHLQEKTSERKRKSEMLATVRSSGNPGDIGRRSQGRGGASGSSVPGAGKPWKLF